MKNITVFLDIDSTLICSVPHSIISQYPYHQYIPLRYIDTPPELFEDGYRIYIRQNLQEFLTYVFHNFDVGIWTHSAKEYATFIVENIILKDFPERKIKYFLTRDDCDEAMMLYPGLKNFQYIWNKYPELLPSNSVIIDDTNYVKETNPYNCIAIIPFKIEIKKINPVIPNQTLSSGNDTVLEMFGHTNQAFINVGTILYLLKENFRLTDGFKGNETIPILMQKKV